VAAINLADAALKIGCLHHREMMAARSPPLSMTTQAYALRPPAETQWIDRNRYRPGKGSPSQEAISDAMLR
jgi:hypothetical protein